MGYLEDRFGIPRSLFDDYLLFRRGNAWYLLRDSAHLEAAGTLKISKAGLKAFRRVSVYVKPTGRAVQIFGYAATRARMEIGSNRLAELLAGKAIPAELGDLERGYVILALKGGPVLGLGFYDGGRIRSQLPRKGVGSLGDDKGPARAFSGRRQDDADRRTAQEVRGCAPVGPWDGQEGEDQAK